MAKVADQFYIDVLKLIKAPVTLINLSLLKKWQTFEGGNATFNPLNTTQRAAGATNYNSATVKNYPDYNTGVMATAQTLTNKYYPTLLEAIRANKPIEALNTPKILQEIKTWGTVNLADYISKLGKTAPTIVKKKNL